MPDAVHLSLVQVNDVHAYLELHPELFWVGDHAEYRMVGGYARIAALINAIRAEQPGRVIALDCGDTLHGTYPAVKTQGEALLPLLNAIHFDAMTAHWEFAYGPEQFKRNAARLDYPVLAINCYDKATGQLVFKPYTICEAGGLRVGIIGIASNIIDKTMPPAYSEGVRFTLGNEELPGYIARLRNEEKVDLIVVMSHLGFPQEMKLAQEVDGIDVLFSAHTHNRLYQPAVVRQTIVVQSGCHGSFIGRLDLTVEAGKIRDYHHRLISVEQAIAPDPQVEALVNAALAPYREELNTVVGYTATPLNRNTVLESTMDNFLLQGLLRQTGAQIAFSNGWRYGAPIVPGAVTLNDLYNIIPVDPPVSLVDLTGEELRAMLEENLEHTFARDPFQQMGGYVKRCLGLTVYCKIENPYGQRIQEMFVGNTPVTPAQVYHAAFVTAQGVPARYGTNRHALDIHAVEALRRYLSGSKPIHAELRGTVVAV